ncbi:MAG: hypothetical protein U0X87_14780 [Anaerolineales bacterium]
MSTFFWLPTKYNVKSFNKHAALDLIRFGSGGMSRSELADKMGLTRKVVSLIVNDLLESNVVRECRSTISAKRKTAYNLGSQLKSRPGRRNRYGGYFTPASPLPISQEESYKMPSSLSISGTNRTLSQTINEKLLGLMKAQGISKSDISAVGVGALHSVITEAGTVVSPPDHAGMGRLPHPWRVGKLGMSRYLEQRCRTWRFG